MRWCWRRYRAAAAGLPPGCRSRRSGCSGCAALAARFPRALVLHEAIYVVDGTLWTSAGVTTGIGMALAMVEEDLGPRVANDIAAQAVLYARRPGFQSQFSPALVAQLESSDPLGASIAWARRHLPELNVVTLSRRAGLTVRTLHRRTRALLGVTPAKLIERIRVEHARTLLSSTDLPQKVVASQAGFSGNAQMQRALARHLGMDGRAVRLLFRADAGPRKEPSPKERSSKERSSKEPSPPVRPRRSTRAALTPEA